MRKTIMTITTVHEYKKKLTVDSQNDIVGHWFWSYHYKSFQINHTIREK